MKKPQTDNQWLAFAEQFWTELVNHCGLDPAFVGTYKDESVISYAKSLWSSWNPYTLYCVTVSLGTPFQRNNRWNYDVFATGQDEKEARQNACNWLMQQKINGIYSDTRPRAESAILICTTPDTVLRFGHVHH